MAPRRISWKIDHDRQLQLLAAVRMSRRLRSGTTPPARRSRRRSKASGAAARCRSTTRSGSTSNTSAMHPRRRASFVNDGKADLLATAANQTSSSETWGGSTTKFKLAVTFTPQQEGLDLRARESARRRRATFYIDPLDHADLRGKPMTEERAQARDCSDASVIRGSGIGERAEAHGRYEIECIGADGKLKWRETIDNVVCTVGQEPGARHVPGRLGLHRDRAVRGADLVGVLYGGRCGRHHGIACRMARGRRRQCADLYRQPQDRSLVGGGVGIEGAVGGGVVRHHRRRHGQGRVPRASAPARSPPRTTPAARCGRPARSSAATRR